jgi:hypothetical protein
MRTLLSTNDFKKLLIILIVILALAIFGLSMRQVALANQPTPQPQPPPFVSGDPDAYLLEFFKEELNRTTSEEERQDLEKRVAVLEREATMGALPPERRAPRPAKTSESAAATLAFTGTRRTGIIEDPSVPFSSMTFLAENGWQEKIGETWVMVVAGTLTKDPQQGVIRTTAYSGSRHYGGQFFTPSKDGTLRIVDAQGFRLVLMAENGNRYYFDVPGMRFVADLEEVVPAVNLLPELAAPTTTPNPAYPYP